MMLSEFFLTETCVFASFRRNGCPGTDAAQANGRGEVKRMDNKKVDEFELALSEFVKRASQKDATAEEVEALPAVARVLLDAIRDLP